MNFRFTCQILTDENMIPYIRTIITAEFPFSSLNSNGSVQNFNGWKYDTALTAANRKTSPGRQAAEMMPIVQRAIALLPGGAFHTDKIRTDKNSGTHREFFRNIVKSNRIQIVFTIFRLIWNQTVVHLVPNQWNQVLSCGA